MAIPPTVHERLDCDEELRIEFNDWAKAGKGPGMEKGHRPVGEQAVGLMTIPPTAHVLDVGCGSGWATRLMASLASEGRAVGIDISDEMVRVANESSQDFPNTEYRVASAAKLPFADGEFTHAFSMESLYYYVDMAGALNEIRRVLRPGGMFVNVVDLYEENKATHRWIEQLNVPVHLLSADEYRTMFEQAGFINVRHQRLYDPTPVPKDYQGGTFKDRAEFLSYRQTGSLMVIGEASHE